LSQATVRLSLQQEIFAGKLAPELKRRNRVTGSNCLDEAGPAARSPTSVRDEKNDDARITCNVYKNSRSEECLFHDLARHAENPLSKTKAAAAKKSLRRLAHALQ
jgi:hypothetical protein